MIVFDLRCAKDHVFEAWFPDSKTFDRQAKKKQVVCPVCGDTRVEKALMAPNISTGRKKDAEKEQAQAAKVMRALSEIRRQVEDNCDYVGPQFAEEARKIHHGETEERGIYGEATKEESKELADEGIEVGVIPWVPRADN